MSQSNLLLGTRIKELCQEKGISVRQCERDAGISERTIARWDVSIPSVDKVMLVARSLGVPVSELLGEEKPTTEGGEYVSESPSLNAKREELIHDIFRLTDQQASALLALIKAFLRCR